MFQHTQTIRRQQPTNFLSVYDRFLGLALKGLICNYGFPTQRGKSLPQLDREFGSFSENIYLIP